MDLLRVGTRHLWFVLSLLGDSERLFNDWVLGVERRQRLELLDCVVRWLPEIITLAPFFAVDPGAIHLRCPFWAEGILRLAEWCGWKFTLHEIEAEFAGDWCRALVETGAIKHDGDRFRVTQRFTDVAG